MKGFSPVQSMMRAPGHAGRRIRSARPIALALSAALALLAGCSVDAANGSTAPAGGDFVLQSAAGPFDSRSQRGKVLLVYFGYTHCPDFCPASLGNAAQAVNRLPPGERAGVKLAMISVDPERDTPAELAKYAAYFHHDMVGLTGSAREIAAVADRFGARYIKQPARPDGAYGVDHDVRGFVVGPDGKLATMLKYDASVDEIVAALRQWR